MRTLSHILITAGAGVGLQKRGAAVHLKAFLLGSVLPDVALIAFFAVRGARLWLARRP